MSEPLLRATDITRSFGRHAVLRGVNLAIAPGTLVGIVGENGAGKSTLLRILAGELRPNRGAITRTGALGYCPQTVLLNDTLSVNQHLAYFGAAYDLTDLSYAQTLIASLGYEKYRSTPVGTLSGGTRQKVNLTLALMHQPEVLLLDEPYQGFDWETYLRFWDLADQLRSQGRAVLVISHLLFDQQRFDALYRLENGQLASIPVQRSGSVSETVGV
ncbi:MAG TPA: ABC transporter ATP-binding protein [Ktedonobacterales bacterium]|nr:ABC transporter ATP-binding protein [Ktedonobacterales bacterium]